MKMITEAETCRYVMTIDLAKQNWSCLVKVHLIRHLLLQMNAQMKCTV